MMKVGWRPELRKDGKKDGLSAGLQTADVFGKYELTMSSKVGAQFNS